MKTVTTEEFNLKLLQGFQVIDVRAPIEFAQGALPNSVNIPLLDDQERALVGTCYKKSGREKALELGHQIVSGVNKAEKLQKWKSFYENHSHSVLTCFRGGLRSQSVQIFLAEVGIEIPRIEYGYKEIRQFYLHEIEAYCKNDQLKILTGSTGSGKTKLLKRVREFYPVIDLEELAQHRGSAFGAMKNPQPAQASFENYLAYEILRHKSQNPKAAILFEDESRLIGSLHLPEVFFNKLRATSVIKINVDLAERIENIFEDYIYPEATIFDKYLNAILKIEKKLGGLRAQELRNDLNFSKTQFVEEGLLVSNKTWIEKLLVWYYDPMYAYSLAQRNPKIEFQGQTKDVIEYLRNEGSWKNIKL